MSNGVEIALLKARNAEKRGDLVEAQRLYASILEKFPRNARAITGLEQVREAQPPEPPQAEIDQLIAAYQQGQFSQAASQGEVLAARHPGFLPIHNILGAAYIALKQFPDAEKALRHALAIDDAYPELHNNLGISLMQQGKFEAAIAAYDRALSLKPDYSSACYNLGNALKKLHAIPAAIEAYTRAVTLKPDYVDAYNNLGMALQEQGHPGEAIKAYNHAIAVKPDAAEAYINLANALILEGKLDEAVRAFGQALKIRPDNASALIQKLHAQTHICDFSAYDEFAALPGIPELPGNLFPPFTLLVFHDDPERQLRYSQAWARDACERSQPPLPASTGTTGGKIRIGYFSADFHNHATLHLMAGLLREHDRQRFEIFAYSYGPACSDEMRIRLMNDVDCFTEIRDILDMDIVSLARSHGLDIAIDLKGYTHNSRSQLFAYRLAPIQINYLGYPGSMGADFIDYLIADSTVIPESEKQFYSEKIIYLPGSYQPNDNRRAIAQTETTRADFSLPEDAFVFCCFNQNYKITPREFDIWMRLLAEVKGSVLWLLRSNPWAEASLRKEAEARGIDPARLIFAEKLPHAEHLARHRHADLFLDTFNVNAHTTASDALWAGLPVVTKAGRQFAARVCASLLNAIGLPELVAESEEAYEALILDLAATPGKLATIRSRLADNRATRPLFDTQLYTRKIEAAYLAAYQRHISGLSPAAILIS